MMKCKVDATGRLRATSDFEQTELDLIIARGEILVWCDADEKDAADNAEALRKMRHTMAGFRDEVDYMIEAMERR